MIVQDRRILPASLPFIFFYWYIQVRDLVILRMEHRNNLWPEVLVVVNGLAYSDISKQEEEVQESGADIVEGIESRN
jgi:hypothetical protein